MNKKIEKLTKAAVDCINSIIPKYPHCRLRWVGYTSHSGPLWSLDNITPVGIADAAHMIACAGADMRKAGVVLDRLRAAQVTEREKQKRLVESAKKKLTPAEIKACGL